MRTIHLCCGRGGSLWTGAILGWQNIFGFDINPWCCEALASDGWPGLTVACGDIATVQWNSIAVGRVDCIAAGFSCKDLSAAGSGAGLDGKSTGPTWRGCLRAIDHFRPRWVFFENSPRIKPCRSIVWREMRQRGYDPRDGTLDAADVGAPHKRRRWFMLAARADADSDQCPWECAATNPRDEARGNASALCAPREPVSTDALRDRLQDPLQCRGLSQTGAEAIQAAAGYCEAHHWNKPDTGLLRVVDGLADRSKRIEALGDAWVPLQAAAAWCLLGGPVGDTADVAT